MSDEQKTCLLHHCLEENGICKECKAEFGIDSFRIWLKKKTKASKGICMRNINGKAAIWPRVWLKKKTKSGKQKKQKRPINPSSEK